jgi:hypothetical protein
MAVAIHGDLDTRVTEVLLDLFWVLAPGDQQRRTGVAEVVDA